jgi:pilus assembly protein CpaC
MVSSRTKRGKRALARIPQGARKWAAAGLCAASFLLGELLWGQQAAPGVLGEYPQATAGDGQLKAINEETPPASQSTTGKSSAPGASLRPTTVQAVLEVPVVKATPLPVKQAAATEAPDQKSQVTQAVTESTASEEHLAPIVPAWSVPRPGKKTSTPTKDKLTSKIQVGGSTVIASPKAQKSSLLPKIETSKVQAKTTVPTDNSAGTSAGVGVPTTMSSRRSGEVSNPFVLQEASEETGQSGQGLTASSSSAAGANQATPIPQFVPNTTQAAVPNSAQFSAKTEIVVSKETATPKSNMPKAEDSPLVTAAPSTTASTTIQTAKDDSSKSAAKSKPTPSAASPSVAGLVHTTVVGQSSSGPEEKRESAHPKSGAVALATGEALIGAKARTPKAKTEPAVKTADFEAALMRATQQPGLNNAAREDELGKLPAGSPFEAIEESGSLRLRVRRSMLLRTKVDIYRTAIVDDAVCDLVQFTPREVSIIGRSVGQTHVTFWFDDPAMAPLTYLVKVEADAQQIKQDEDKYQLLENVINEMFPDSKVHLVLVADKLLVKGQAKDSEEAAQIMIIIRAQASGARGGIGGMGGYGSAYAGLSEGPATPVLSLGATGGNPGPAYQIINMLRVPGVQQVALKVKIAELNRSAARGFGVDVNGVISISDSVKGTQLFLSSLLNASTSGGTALITSFDGENISVGIRYLQERGVIRLLSEPTLVTLSGRPATFIAGGEFAVPTIVGNVGLNAVTTDFRAFGAIISFLPTIVDKDRIRLQVAPEFSQINKQLAVGNTPGLNIRAATTTVEMREGQTLAIAGLLEDSYKASNIGDLPGLAKIFGRRDTARNETELIILVTPELVHPMEAEEVPPLPGFDVTEPTGAQFFFHGDIEGNPTQDYRSTVWPRLRRRYGMGGPAMTSGPFGHGQ